MKRAFRVLPFVFALVLFLSLSSCAFALPKKKLTIETQSGTKINVRAELAKTNKAREKGYMERKIIPEGTGMLFVFENDQILRFWMKNTPSPLSIAYIDYKGVVRDIFDMTPYSLAETVSTCYVRYALEVPQGWFEKVGIKTGDCLILDF